MKIFIWLVSLFFTFSGSILLAQDYSKVQDKISEVYEKLALSIPDKSQEFPILKFSDRQRAGAYYNPQNNSITIEYSIADIASKFSKSDLDLIAYILAHELAHKYLQHGWVKEYGSAFASQQFGKKLKNIKRNQDQRVLDETQADIFAALLTKQSGFNPLVNSKPFLDSLYTIYGLKPDLPGYPSLEERKEILDNAKKEFSRIHVCFNTANLSFKINEFSVAGSLLKWIINQNFKSREIYNNLGLSIIFETFKIHDLTKYDKLPFTLELITKSSTSDERSISTQDANKILQNIDDAITYFRLSSQLDPTFYKAKLNEALANLVKFDLTNDPKSKLSCQLNILEIPENVYMIEKEFISKLLDGTKTIESNQNIDYNQKNKPPVIYFSSLMTLEENKPFVNDKRFKIFRTDNGKILIHHYLEQDIYLYFESSKKQDIESNFKVISTHNSKLRVVELNNEIIEFKYEVFIL